MGVLGDTLRQARAQKGVTLKEAEQATRINRHYLSALEDENFVVLPALIYQRGIVRSYATYLGLDAGKLLAMFEEARGGESTSDLVAAVKPLEMPNHWAPNFAIITFMVVMGAIVFAWIYSLSFNEQAPDATIAAEAPTVTRVPIDRLGVAAQSPAALPTQSAAIAQEGTLEAERSGEPEAVADATDSTTVAGPVPTLAPLELALPTAAGGSADVAQQLLPTPTPQPTATPSPTPPTPTPSPIPTEPPSAVAAAPAQGAPGTSTIRIVAQGDIYVSVADGSGVQFFAGSLSAGMVTDWFTATSFSVYTSNGQLTWFENQQTGAGFYMGYGVDETYYLGG